MTLNKKLFPDSYSDYNQVLGGKTESSPVESSVLSTVQVQSLVQRTAKQSAIAQAYQSMELSASAIANQNANTSEIYLGLLPNHAIGQAKTNQSTLGTMAILAGGFYGPNQPTAIELTDYSAIEEANYTNKISEFNYTQGFTELSITLTTASRYYGNSSSNLVNSYFYGGFAGKLPTPTVQAISVGTNTIDRYNRPLKSISQIATKVQGPWCCFCASYNSSMGNLVKTILQSGERINPNTWAYSPLNLGNNIQQYGNNQLQRFVYNGEDIQVIAATLIQPRLGTSTLQGDSKTAFTLFGINAINANTGNFNYSIDYDKGTQFDLENEISSPISESRGYGGTRYNGGVLNSKANSYIFSGLNYDISTTPQTQIKLKSIFEFNFSTKSGSELGFQYPINAGYLKGVSAQDNGYLLNSQGNNASHQFNFARKDLTPLAITLITQSNYGWLGMHAESDYSPGWGI